MIHCEMFVLVTKISVKGLKQILGKLFFNSLNVKCVPETHLSAF